MNSQNDFSEKLFLLKLLRLSQVPISEADLARTVYGEDTVRSRRAVRKHLYEMHGDFFGNESNGVSLPVFFVDSAVGGLVFFDCAMTSIPLL